MSTSEATPAALLDASDLEELERGLQRSTGRAARVAAIPPPAGQKRKTRRGRVTIPNDEVIRAPQPLALPGVESWIPLLRPLDLEHLVEAAFARRPAAAAADFTVDIEVAAGVPAPAEEAEAPPISDEPEYANPTLIEVADQEPATAAPEAAPKAAPPPPPPATPPPPLPAALRVGFGAPEAEAEAAAPAPIPAEEPAPEVAPVEASAAAAPPAPPAPGPAEPEAASVVTEDVAAVRPVVPPPVPPAVAAVEALAAQAAKPSPPPIPAGRGTPAVVEEDGRTPPPIPAEPPRLRSTSGEISIPPPVPRTPAPAESSVESEPVVEDATEPESSLGPLTAITAEAAAPPPTEAETAHGPPALPAELARKPKKTKKFKKPWFEEFFDDDFLKTIPGVTPVFTAKEANYIQKQLGLDKGAHLLDIGCGYGRQSVEFARAGFQVTGLDTSLPLLIQAAEAARTAEVEINFMHLDMRELAAQDEYDGAFCVMTSFGYFEDDANADVIRRVCAALKPGGRFYLEVINRDFILPDLPSRVWWEGDECLVMDEVDFNYLTSRITTSRSVVFNDGRSVNHEMSIRAYCLHELGRLLHSSGFRVLSVTGNMNTEGRFFGTQSSHLIIVSEKPRTQ